MSGNYYDGIYGLNLNSIANDPMWQKYASSMISFRGDSTNVAATDSLATNPVATNSVASYTTDTEKLFNNDVQPLPQKSKKGNKLAYFGGAILTIGAASLIAKKTGKTKGLVDSVKKLINIKPTRPMSAFTMVAKDGSRVIVKNGKIFKVEARGASKVFKTESEVQNYITTHSLNLPNYIDDATGKLAKNVSLTRFAINNGGYKFIVENGQITKVIDNAGKEIKGAENIAKFFEGKQPQFKTNIETAIANITSGTQKIRNLDPAYIRYEYADGKGLVYSNWLDMGTKRLTVPGEINKSMTEAQQKAWLHINQDVETKVNDIIASGRAENVVRERFWFKADNGDRLLISKDGEIEAILLAKKPKTGPQTITKGSTEYHSYLHDNEAIEKAAKKEYESGLATDGEHTLFSIE